MTIEERPAMTTEEKRTTALSLVGECASRLAILSDGQAVRELVTSCEGARS
jgi:hypothetical protein